MPSSAIIQPMPMKGWIFAARNDPMPNAAMNHTIVTIVNASRMPNRTMAYGSVRITSAKAVPKPARSMASGYEWRTGASGWL